MSFIVAHGGTFEELNGEAKSSALHDVQFLRPPGGGERLAIVPESLFFLLEGAFQAQLAGGNVAHGPVEILPRGIQHRIDQGESPVRAVRKWRRLSGARLARLAGISASMLSQIEVHSKTGSADTYVRISRVLDVSLDVLLMPRSSPEQAQASPRPGWRKP